LENDLTGFNRYIISLVCWMFSTADNPSDKLEWIW
jgi:hypothetical protein